MLKTASRCIVAGFTGKWPTTIQVKDVSKEQSVEVFVRVKTLNGPLTVRASELEFYRSIGLTI